MIDSAGKDQLFETDAVASQAQTHVGKHGRPSGVGTTNNDVDRASAQRIADAEVSGPIVAGGEVDFEARGLVGWALDYVQVCRPNALDKLSDRRHRNAHGRPIWSLAPGHTPLR